MTYLARSVYELEDPAPGPASADGHGIRRATLGDVPRLVDMGVRFLGSSAYAATLTSNPEQMARVASCLIGDARGLVLVSEAAGRLTGMFGMMIFPHVLSGELVAGELFWWVEPEARGAGLRLLRQAEAWALSQGVRRVQMVAPTPALSRVYARLGYAAIETTFCRLLPIGSAQSAESSQSSQSSQTSSAPRALEDVAAACRGRVATGAAPLTSIASAAAVVGLGALRVHDDVLPADYRQFARARTFGSVPIGPVTFHGIAPCADQTLVRWIQDRYPHARPTLTFFRESPAGQHEPNFVHTDRDMGDWTAILYLTDDPAPADGTTFWRHRETGATASTATTEEEFRAEWQQWRDLSLWEPWQTVRAAPCRLLLFPAPCFHSRALFENYGAAGADARLVQLVFGTGSLELAEGAPCV
jgi:GNAT superfamily N-acetyltransferase